MVGGAHGQGGHGHSRGGRGQVVGVVYAEGVGCERIESLAEQSIARRNHVERKVDKSRLVEIVNWQGTAQALGPGATRKCDERG